MNKDLKLSVHQLVDFLLRSGDIDNRVFNKATMQEGTKIHAYYQKKQKHDYLSEYYLFEHFNVQDFDVSLEGRADGIILNGDDATIDEIKSTVSDLDDFHFKNEAWHIGQAKCYALMFAHEKNLKNIAIRLTYIHQLTNEKKVFDYFFKVNELEKFVLDLIGQYLDFYTYIFNRTEKRNESAKKIEFPFKTYRDGQRTLAKYSYGIAKEGGTLFCEAPTGIGKTISTLYPFIKSFKDGKNEKIFYLTAKTSGKESAFNTISLLISKGLIVSDIVLTAKEKVCYCPNKSCNPEECPFAKGYYSKLRDVIIKSIHNYNQFSKETILKIASDNGMCPFELSLDLSLYVDIIICDYNYFFDPMVYLRRYFDGDTRNVLALVDEAHNLVERGRNMYSASISKNAFLKAKKSFKILDHKKIKNASKRIDKMFKKYGLFPDGETLIDNIEITEYRAIEAYLLAALDVMKHHHDIVDDSFKDFYFELNRFSRLLDFYDESSILYVHKDGKDIRMSLLCLDPSLHIYNSLNQIKGRIIFSGTLSPINYYVEMLGGNEKTPILKLPSPYNKDNLCLMIAPKISIKYKKRDDTLQQVADYLKAFVDGKVGNYFIYVPSYAYLEKIKPYLFFDAADVYVQEKDMNEEDKKNLLSLFVDNPKKTTVLVSVVGGTFSEGIDLANERLIGVAVVGIGLPQISFEKDQIREYFDKKENGLGYLYSYVDPGMNKVMQAVGRVIRGENDKGAALLIDDRYLNQTYRDLFKNEWTNYKVVTTKEDVENELASFWSDNSKLS